MNLEKDLSTITTIPEKSLIKLSSKSVECIGHNFYESIIADDSDYVTKVDSQIGNLYIKYNTEDDSVEYRFVPSERLDTTIRTVVEKKESPLTADVEAVLVQKILSTYKELL